jgi:hypothetical protein
VKHYRYEIFRRTYRGYSWRFVVLKDGQRQVLARSHRDYRSRKKVKRAIDALQHADVVDLSVTPVPVLLPHSTFKFVPGVSPLMVGDYTVAYAASSLHPAVQEDIVQQDAIEAKAAEGAAAAKPKPVVAPGVRRGKKAT